MRIPWHMTTSPDNGGTCSRAEEVQGSGLDKLNRVMCFSMLSTVPTMGETGILVALLVLLSGRLGNQGEGRGLCRHSGADKKAEERMGSRTCWGDEGFTGKTTVFLQAGGAEKAQGYASDVPGRDL